MIEQLVNLVSGKDVIRATKFVSPTSIIRATRRTYGSGNSASDPIEILITFGKPNYLEREFIRLCKKIGEPFPVKKIQLKFKKRK